MMAPRLRPGWHGRPSPRPTRLEMANRSPWRSGHGDPGWGQRPGERVNGEGELLE
jgi:hypothetical protein